jgi:hypothetical protein
MAFSGNLLKHVIPCSKYCRETYPKPMNIERKPSVEEINRNALKMEKPKKIFEENEAERDRNAARNARMKLSNLRNQIFSRSHSTKITGASDNGKYRVRCNSREKNHLTNKVTVENGLREHHMLQNNKALDFTMNKNDCRVKNAPCYFQMELQRINHKHASV